ncbi:MAG TPA: ribosome maturation factor RimM [Pyrinomonadaceae bacterium]|jgi:16S rRNA processing protein RimM|nr:ribosome maturation factor RimM [Pyrinomonadaceae bacterium]
MSETEREDGAREASQGDGREAAEELVAVAKVLRTRGVRGELVAELLTDFPERFEDLERLIAVSPKGARAALALEDQWLQGGRIVLKFAGYDTPEEAAALVGYELAVPEAEAVELEDDEFYNWQLVGCRVETIGGVELGQVREVLEMGGASPVLLIKDAEAGSDAREHLVPLVASICVEIDTGRKLIRVDAPEGLLEI